MTSYYLSSRGVYQTDANGESHRVVSRSNETNLVFTRNGPNDLIIRVNNLNLNILTSFAVMKSHSSLVQQINVNASSGHPYVLEVSTQSEWILNSFLAIFSWLDAGNHLCEHACTHADVVGILCVYHHFGLGKPILERLADWCKNKGAAQTCFFLFNQLLKIDQSVDLDPLLQSAIEKQDDHGYLITDEEVERDENPINSRLLREYLMLTNLVKTLKWIYQESDHLHPLNQMSIRNCILEADTFAARFDLFKKSAIPTIASPHEVVDQLEEQFRVTIVAQRVKCCDSPACCLAVNSIPFRYQTTKTNHELYVLVAFEGCESKIPVFVAKNHLTRANDKTRSYFTLERVRFVDGKEAHQFRQHIPMHISFTK